MKPLVTVIVPIYNNEKYIDTCLEAVVHQSYENLQIILVDDGSTDQTYEMCRVYEDSRILLLQKENGGASSARNMGLNYAEGEYVYFADSDDYLEKHAIEKLVQTAKQEKADCVILEANNYTEDGIKVKKDGLSFRIDYPHLSGNELIPMLMDNKDYHAAPFLYFAKRSIYEKGLRFEEGIMFEDELFSFQLLRNCNKVVVLREKLYNRRVRLGSVMTSTGKGMFRFESITKVLQRLWEMYEVEPADKTLKKYVSRITLLWYSYWKQMTEEEKEKKMEEYKEIRKRILKVHGFGSSEVVVRCYGYYIWRLYILPGRCIRKIRLRSLK